MRICIDVMNDDGSDKHSFNFQFDDGDTKAAEAGMCQATAALVEHMDKAAKDDNTSGVRGFDELVDAVCRAWAT